MIFLWHFEYDIIFWSILKDLSADKEINGGKIIIV